MIKSTKILLEVVEIFVNLLWVGWSKLIQVGLGWLDHSWAGGCGVRIFMLGGCKIRL